MTSVAYLADTSVWGRADIPDVGSRLANLVDRHLLWTCRVVDLELAVASRAKDVASLIEERHSLPEAGIGDSVMNRALQVAGLLAQGGLHRSAGPVDLVIAAAAEAANVTLLHYDADFERIAAVTNQPTEWIAEPGTLD